jgi:hypothetical protein
MAPLPSTAYSSDRSARIGFVSHISACRPIGSDLSLPLGELALFFRAPLEERFLLTLFLAIAYCSVSPKANWLCFARLAWGRLPASPYAPAADYNRRLAVDLDPGHRLQGCRRENWLRFAFSARASLRLPVFSVSPVTSGANKEEAGDVPPSCSTPRPAPVLFSCTNWLRPRATPRPRALLTIHFSIAASSQ